MLRIHRHGDELEDVVRVDAWVHRLAANAIADHYRRAGPPRAPVRRRDRCRPGPVEAEEPGQAELRSELAACLAPMIERLPPIYREALELTELGGVSQVEPPRISWACRSRG